MAFGRRQGKPLPYPPGSGEELAARWLRWVASVPSGKNPLSDPTGERAGVNQPGDVWFLAGNFGGPVNRSCTVPAGLPLFFPVFNIWRQGGPPPVVPSATAQLAFDGAPAPVQEIGTPEAFDVPGAALNPVTNRMVSMKMSIWGYWGWIAPPAPGPHTVHFTAGAGTDFTLDIAYSLTIAGR
jgi:hypothetical protein